MAHGQALKMRQLGYLLSSEMMLIAVILVLGLLVGWVSLRDSISAELMDVSNAIESSIQIHYFSDPDRNVPVPAFTDDALIFADPDGVEGVAP